MPKWYGTFPVEHPFWNRFVSCEAPDRDTAWVELQRITGMPVTTVYDEHHWTATNWAGHTHAQRQGLTELRAPEEDQNRVEIQGTESPRRRD